MYLYLTIFWLDIIILLHFSFEVVIILNYTVLRKVHYEQLLTVHYETKTIL